MSDARPNNGANDATLTSTGAHRPLRVLLVNAPNNPDTEATVNLGYWLTPHVKAYVGYNCLFWSNVVRPGDQIQVKCIGLEGNKIKQVGSPAQIVRVRSPW